MKTRFFPRPDAGRLRKTLILLLISIVVIAIAIPGMILSKGNSLFAILYFAGFVLFFYALLHSWQKVSYYAISIAIYLGLLILFLYKGIDLLVKMGIVGNLHDHKAEDLAWTIGSIFVAGIVAGIIGIIRVRMFTYDDDNDSRWVQAEYFSQFAQSKGINWKIITVNPGNGLYPSADGKIETVVIERGKPDDHQGAIKVILSKAGIIL